MPNPAGGQKYTDLPLNIVGSNKFGRYPKQSIEQTFNMIQADNALVGFAGYEVVDVINPTGEGRGDYSSTILNLLFVVIDNNLFSFDSSLSRTFIGALETYSGIVYMAENNAGQIAVSDSINLYIWDSRSRTFTTLTDEMLGFTPGYLTFQNGRFITPALTTNNWRLSEPNNGLLWPNDAQHVGSLQTKPDNAVGTIRFPGRSGLLLVFGEIVSEPWYDAGLQLFPYQRSQTTNFDYGCVNPATIAEGENMVAWLSINEKSGPVISYTNGSEIEHISTDGIDFVMSNLTEPSDSFGYFLKLSGHLFYVLTFKTDNLTYAYDFNTKSFYTLTDEKMDFFTPRRIAFFNDEYYFVSINDGNLYRLSADLTSYNYGNGNEYEIPRIRVLSPIRLPDQSYFITGYAGFTIEQGTAAFIPPNDVPRIDLTMSKDGGYNFGGAGWKFLNPLGQRANRLMWYQLGMANDLTLQYRFHGFNRYVCLDGIVGVFQ
jgi:hypothetical protein